MFTFGREHERKCAVAYVRNRAQADLILHVVDAVHDLLEGKASAATLASTIRAAFVEGGSGVWEQAATWLRKTAVEHPELVSLWLELAQHPETSVRFRVACGLDDIPAQVFAQVANTLTSDKSKKVANMAKERSLSRPELLAGQSDSG